MSGSKRRGRRPNSSSPKIAAADTAIARTVYYLSTLGFHLKTRKSDDPGVYEVVGIEAKKILGRGDHEKKPLGPDRVKEIFDAWFKSEKKSRIEGRQWPLMERRRYLKDSLAGRRIQRMSLNDHAAELLRSEGKWCFQRPLMPSEDLTLSPSAKEQLGELTDQATDILVEKLMQFWIEKNGQPSPAIRDVLRQVYVRAIGIAYRANALGIAPESLKNGLEK